MKFIGDAAAFVWNIVQTIRPNDILDIAVVALIIYKIISFVAKTGLAKVIRGIIFLLAVLWLSTLLDLNVVELLMGNTIELCFIAIIILFQPELRRMLERVGSSNITQLFGRNVNVKELETAIDQSVSACIELSKSRTGALIAFERDIKLDDPVKTGSILNANTLAELLVTIFFPNTPLHDGAVIIRDGKITAAGCMLPLSNNPNLSRALGMRHKAGIGLSETSDAVVVVVSEETGSISVAVDGMLKRHLAPDTLGKLQKRVIMDDTTEEENIFERISKVKNNDKKTITRIANSKIFLCRYFPLLYLLCFDMSLTWRTRR